MKFTRRNFIKTGGLTAVGLIGLANAPARIFGSTQFGGYETDALYSLRSEFFKDLIGTKFTIYGEDFAVATVLESVRDCEVESAKKSAVRNQVKKSNAESFTLIFRLPAGELPQAVYKVFHPNIGQFDLLLVPGGDSADKPNLAAVINRI